MNYLDSDSPLLARLFAGGMVCTARDPAQTLLEYNPGFLTLAGFTAEELAREFGGSYDAMICPEDREALRGEIDRQLSQGDSYTAIYRLLGGDRSYRWVVESGCPRRRGGTEYLLRIAQDITFVQRTKEELALSLERHKIIMDQTADVIWEWNLSEDTLLVSPNWLKKFGYPIFTERVLQSFAACEHVHGRDRRALARFLELVQEGAPYSELEFRMSDAAGKFAWYRIRATVMFDPDRRPSRAVGVITDIDREQRRLEEYRRRAATDALTGLYNRDELQRQVAAALADRSPGALLMLDTDNFKAINDTKGHLYGDALLSGMARGIKRLVGRDGCVGRIGGDEFAVYLYRADRAGALAAADRLRAMCNSLFPDEKTPDLSCSVGVALYPGDGRNFQTLYRHADRALYEAKKQGKNRCVFYAPGLGQMRNSPLGAEIDSDARLSDENHSFSDYVFEILYSATDLFRAVDLILEIIGKRFDVSRVYIFENSEDATHSSNTFEWCNEGIRPQKDELQAISFEELGNYQNLFDGDGVFFCRDVAALDPVQSAFLANQGIRSMLQCKIFDDDQFWGFVGFDECTGLRLWTQEEVDVLLLTAKLLSTFLIKARALERDRAYGKRLEQILDMQNAYIYAVEKDTFRLLYLNARTKLLDAAARPGMKCHRAFFGSDSPCAQCPIRTPGRTLEIFNPQYGLWTEATARPFDWDGEAFLVSCFDTTAYKK